ncbi:hypothetical protein [Saccharothrix sp. ST-888]|nr:hypothetical protein [Saccharothrix sp. ST-888]
MSHDQYGLGRVVGIEGDGLIAVLVDFGTRQERILPPFAKLFLL